MNFCEPFIRRPVMTTLLMLALLIFGILAYKQLPISDLPNVDFPTIMVSASLPGATPETIASSITTPLERKFSTIAGVESMTSSSTQGRSSIVLQFNLQRDIDSAAQDVQAAIAAATRDLPSDMTAPPAYHKVNPAAAPIIYLALTSKNKSLTVVDEYAETFLAQRISTIMGVAEVDVYGSQKYAVRVQLNPDLLAARNVSLDEVVEAIKQANVNLPTGILQGEQQTIYIQSKGQLTDAAAYRKLVVAYRNGAPLQLAQLGNVVDSVENNKTATWFNDQRSVVLAVQKRPGANTIEVVDNIKKILPSFRAMLPGDIDLQISNDRSTNIRAAIHDVQVTLIIAAILVIAVIYVFLRNFSAIIMPAVALPLSLIGTFAVMYFFDFSLDNLSLLALTLAVGFVVDDAIVMLENIMRHLEQGESPLTAALRGSKEIAFTIVSMTVSLAVVFIPVLFMSGVIGRVLHEFAVTICAAILLSGLISLTLTPLMARLFLRSGTLQQQQHDNYFILRLKGIYQRSLDVVLQYPRWVMMSFFLSIVLTLLLLGIMPKTLLPSVDAGTIFAFTETDPAMSFLNSMKLQQQVADIIQHNSSVENVVSSIGAGGTASTSNAGRIFIRLKPRSQRSQSADQIIQQLRPQISKIPGISVFLQNLPVIRIGARLSKSTYQYTLQSADYAELRQWATVYMEAMAKLPALTDVTSDQQNTGPQLLIHILRNKAAALGVTALQIQNTLGRAYGSQKVSTIYTDIDNYAVILETPTAYQENANYLGTLYIRSRNGSLVPLSAVTSVTVISGPLAINHQGQLPAVTIAFGLKPGYSLSQAVAQIIALSSELHPPASLLRDFSGTAQTFKESQQSLGWLLVLAIVVIYIVLGILYESFIHPLTILSGLPAAGLGALLTLFILRVPLDLYAFIGIIMLLGIVKKNAIMMVDYAITQQHQGVLARDAIYQACIVRFRPIMMTTFAALLGTLPIALAFGEAAEMRRPLGLAVVGGLLVSQLITLYITPVIYLYLERFNLYMKNKLVNTHLFNPMSEQ